MAQPIMAVRRLFTLSFEGLPLSRCPTFPGPVQIAEISPRPLCSELRVLCVRIFPYVLSHMHFLRELVHTPLYEQDEH